MQPAVKMPGLSPEGFADAFAVLEECRVDRVPVLGFTHPFFAPGGAYGGCWWNIDSSVALLGYRWKDRAFAENALRNFFDVQKEDGRIPLYGYDSVAPYDEEISSLPKLLEVAYLFAAESEDAEFVCACYRLIARYLNWWLQKRRDAKTGLISAVFEETFVPYLHKSGERAAVDTNVEVILGCRRAAALARRLGEAAQAERYGRIAAEISDSVNRLLWNEEKGAYYPLLLSSGLQEDFLMASAFLPLRGKVALKERADRLVALLTSGEFGWDTYPVYSAARSDPHFSVTEGAYQYNASWSGSVWTLLNEGVVQGLKDSGYTESAAELAWRTVREFHGRYYEFLHPFNGSGQGVQRYAWTAAQYIRLVLEFIFGIKADAAAKTVHIRPLLCEGMRRGDWAAENVPLPGGGTLSVYIKDGAVSARSEQSSYRLLIG